LFTGLLTLDELKTSLVSRGVSQQEIERLSNNDDVLALFSYGRAHIVGMLLPMNPSPPHTLTARTHMHAHTHTNTLTKACAYIHTFTDLTMPSSVLRANDQIDVKLFGGLSHDRSCYETILGRHEHDDAHFALFDREEDKKNSEEVQQRNLTGCEEVTVKVTDVSVAAYTVRLRARQREGRQKQDSKGRRK
jgi:hypothetical protein